MSDLPRPHASFILRCWRDDAGELHGVLIEVRSRVSFPFRTAVEMQSRIDRWVTDVVTWSSEGNILSKRSEEEK